jgi:hypothetical protein
MTKLWLLPVFSLALWGADISGRWAGNIEVADPSNGDKINTPVKAEFDQNGNGISGKIGRTEDEEQQPIRNARMEGKNLVFEVTSPETTGAVHFTLVLLSDDRIEGDMKGAIDIGNITGKVILRKVK